MALLDVALAASNVVYVDTETSPNEQDLIDLGALSSDTTVYYGNGSLDLDSVLSTAVLSSTNIVVTGGADVQISAGLLDLTVITEQNLIIDGDSSITLSAGAVGVAGLGDLLGNTNIAFSGSGDGTFTYNRSTLGLVNSSTLNVAEIAPGDKIVIPITGDGALGVNRLRFDSYDSDSETLRLVNGSQLATQVNVNISMTPAEYSTFNANQSLYLNGNTDTFTFPGDDSDLPIYEIPCFGRGTLLTKDDGVIAVEDICVGDEIMTRDHGLQSVRWVGCKKIDQFILAANKNLRPIRISAGALGNNTPSQDLIVSPQHRVLVRSKIAQKIFGTNEILVAVKQLLQIDGIEIARDLDEIEYYHILFDQHEVVFSNGAETESLFTGSEALKSVGSEARAEIFTLFPELEAESYKATPARTLASGRTGRRLAVRHKQNSKVLVS